MIATLSEAESIAGKLGKPSKMPGYAYGLPARACIVGSALTRVKGTVCSSCYALRGRYVFPNVQRAMAKRLESLRHPQWVDALVFMITYRDCRHFRWHDSGDLQGLWHLSNIVAVAERCPDVYFWLPTREAGIVKFYIRDHGTVPFNLTLRVSAPMIDGAAPSFPNTSTVVTDDSYTCPSTRQHGVCGTCRMCWDRNVQNVSYKKH